MSQVKYSKMIIMKTLRTYLQPWMKMIVGGLVIKVTGSFLELFLPEILSRIIDEIVPQGNMQQIVLWSGVMVFLSLIALVFNILANRNASRVARNVTENIRHDLFDKALYLTCEKTDAYTIPSIESRLTSDTYHMHRMIGMMQRLGVRAPIITIGGLIMTFVLDPFLAMVFLAVIPFMIIILYLRATRGVKMFTAVQKANDRMVGVVRENAQGIRIIKALSKVDYEKNRFHGVNEFLKDEEVRANRMMALINPAMNMLLYLGMVGVILVGAWRVNLGLSKTGRILAFMSYFQMISRSLMAVSRMFIMYSRGMASSARVMEIINSETEKEYVPQEYPDGDSDCALEFRDVTFSYLKIRDNIKNISFRLHKGETLGIIGATGAGKTTILSLLLHFYNIDQGAIYLNGRDIRSFTPSELRRRFGVVMQNDFLFRDTVAENIRFGREVSDEEMLEAEADAQAEEFIHDLPEQNDYQLSVKGANLSGGQRQRVLLSRAFAGRPDFLLLDDSSSALDYRTDAALRKALQEKYPDTTMIIIAQRVSSIKNCDEILVLDHGTVSGRGSHEYLMQNNDLYQDIADSQMGGALFD